MRKLHWKVRRDGGGVLHTAEVDGFKIIITNWPGTRTMWLEVKSENGSTVVNSDFDKAEHGVASAKERALEWIAEHGPDFVNGRRMAS